VVTASRRSPKKVLMPESGRLLTAAILAGPAPQQQAPGLKLGFRLWRPCLGTHSPALAGLHCA
jgi:hypothetical protein